jgi:hypothetical protein
VNRVYRQRMFLPLTVQTCGCSGQIYGCAK